MLPRVLIIAGSDSGGGAGIQGDTKTVTCLGGYAATAITALTAQNTLGVFGIHSVPDDFIAQQIDLVLSDIGADAIKTGMLHSASVIDVIVNHVPKEIPLIVDTVMVAKGGSPLLEPSAIEALKSKLIPRAYVITPNIPEAELLLGRKIPDTAAMEQAARDLLKLGSQAVLLKGGHLEGEEVIDILIENGKVTRFSSPRIASRHTHGTGCTLASALATGIAAKLPLTDAVHQARNYVLNALKSAPELGKGHGPLNHGWILGQKALAKAAC
ncbi:MAG: bifunctional hydroxymethylpyrimidine kinase/phosphomethylpyrimidine kinase [Alphaproteobacteria bacterium]|nr:bifunctional hydroxymethylpyrimidine kinase/phosphomethylpyrimidine kinase [Alphaproteobacteria bacterium]